MRISKLLAGQRSLRSRKVRQIGDLTKRKKVLRNALFEMSGARRSGGVSGGGSGGGVALQQTRGGGGGGVGGGGGGGAVPQQTHQERAAEAGAEAIRQLRQAVQITADCEQLGTETMECVMLALFKLRRAEQV